LSPTRFSTYTVTALIAVVTVLCLIEPFVITLKPYTP
jgi:hypothetical protein